MTDAEGYIGTPAGVREICRNLNIDEVPDSETIDDLKYGYDQIIAGTGKTAWDGTEKVFELAQKVSEEFAAVNIAMRTNVPLDQVALIRKIAEADLKLLIASDPALLVSTVTGGTFVTHGGEREYNYVTMNPDKEYYETPEMDY